MTGKTGNEGPTPLTSAVLVDVDNMLGGLGRQDPAALRAFCQTPQVWLDWLSTLTYPALGELGGRRAILSRVAFRSSKGPPGLQQALLRSGFRVVDCPQRAAAGKNSADISIVIAMLDLLQHPTHYDEVMLLSSDSDFTPALSRLREHDRRTVVVASGPTAALMPGACDHLINVQTFARVLVGAADARVVPLSSVPPTAQAAAMNRVVVAVQKALNNSGEPIMLPTIAPVVRNALGDQVATYAGHRTLSKLLAQLPLPHLGLSVDPPGYVWDTRRHRRPKGTLAPTGPGAATVARG